VSAYRVETSGLLFQGSFADGELGDYVLENDRMAVLIGAIGHAGYYGLSGGNILDAGSSTERIDALGEFYTYFDNDWPRQAVYTTLVIFDDGSGGGPAVIRVTGVDSQNPSIAVVTDYALADGAEAVTVTTTLTNNGGGTIAAFELGDAYYWGECRKYAPGYGFQLSGTTVEPWLAGDGGAIAYGYLSPLGDIWGPHGTTWSDVNVTTMSVGPGESFAFARYFVAGGHDIASVATAMHAVGGMAAGSVECSVTSQATGLPLPGAEIDAYDELGSIYLQMQAEAQGLTATTLPPGSWRLEATAVGYLPLEIWVTVEEGGLTSHDFLLEVDGEIPAVGDTLTVIQRPLLNIPAIVTPGDTLTIECAAPPATSGWAAELTYGARALPLLLVSAVYDPTTLWWQLLAEVPQVSIHELYDLHVTADGGIDDVTRNAVRVIPEFKDDYYFIHITDTHLPTSMYHYEIGAEDDSSSTVDLREVIGDISIINPEFVLLTGDLVNEGELEDYLYWRVYTCSQRLLTELDVPVYLIAGNHDIGGWIDTPPPAGTARRDWWRFYGWQRLDNPPPGMPWHTQNYSFDYGPVHYVALEAYDNYDLWREAIYGETSFTAGQLEWLAADLAAAAGSTSQVLFYHYDFRHELNLSALGVEMALWGHIHRDEGSIHAPPYDLSTNNVTDGERSYRLIRVSNGVVEPTATVSAGADGGNLRVQFSPANNGQHATVTAELTNDLNERFEHGQLRFIMPNQVGGFVVNGGTLLQVDDSGEFAVCYVGVDIQPTSTMQVTVTLDYVGVAPAGIAGAPPAPSLAQNVPNPFRPGTSLRYTLGHPAPVRLAVYDVNGREIVVLVDAVRPSGTSTARWDGRDAHGRPVSAGIYLARLEVEGRILTRKLVLMR
jgi:3',5'-cyclic AMP phosphodiesterase CpdA